jgi:hypothetical protein
MRVFFIAYALMDIFVVDAVTCIYMVCIVRAHKYTSRCALCVYIIYIWPYTNHHMELQSAAWKESTPLPRSYSRCMFCCM